MLKKSSACIHVFLAAAFLLLSVFTGSAVLAQCSNGITAGGFDKEATGIYPAPDYIGGWKAAGTDAVKIVTQGSSNGALIRSRDDEQYSLEQTIYSVKPSFDYTITFTYGNWTNGCNTSARAGILVSVYFDNATVPAKSTEYISNDASTSSIGTFTFTTPPTVSSVRIVITDYKSPKPTCGTVIDDITMISPLTVSTNTTAVSCFGDLSGGFTIEASGGAAPYTAAYSAGGNPPVPLTMTEGRAVASGLPAGNYTVAVTDANGCTVTQEIMIPGPTAALTVRTQPVMCFGDATGSVMAEAAGGMGGYRYTLNGITNTTGFFDNLPAGTYSVTATDQNGCTVTATFSISQPAAALSASAAAMPSSCSGASDGSVTVTATGGSAPYRYTLNGSANTTGSFSGLPAGSYTVTVTDANNCSAFVHTTVGQPAPLIPAATPTPVTCFGGSDGTVTVTATGGSGRYEITLNGTTRQTGVFTGLPAGSYTVRVQDHSGPCFEETVVLVGQPVSALAATAVPARCFGEPTGSVTVTATGGTPGYTYTLNGETNTTGYFPGLPAGTYGITVTDIRGCSAVTSATVGEPAAPLTLAASVFNNNCRGGSTGSITAVASGGIPGYSYRLNGEVSADGTFAGLAAGTYTVFVRDANGCTASTAVTIQEPATAISASAAATDASCFSGADGSLQVTASGGTPAYTYTLDGRSNTTGLFRDLPAGTYTVTITDAVGCSVSIAATVGSPAELTVTAEPSWCFGQTSASVIVQAAGGTPGFAYTLNGVTNTSGVFTGLTAGTYDFQVTDARNCTAMTRIVLVPQTAPLTLSVAAKSDVRCFGEAAGSVIFAGAGGAAPYRYTLDGSSNTTGVFTGLRAGTYTGTVTDHNGCQTTAIVRIGEAGTRIVPVAATTAVNCAGESNGSIRVTATGGSPGYRFSLNGTVNLTGIFSGLPAGTYTVLVTDGNNCTVPVTATVTGPSAPLAAAARAEFCGTTDGSIVVTATGGTPGYSYRLNGQTNTTGIFSGLRPGTYQVLVTDAAGCATSVPVTLSAPADPLSATVSDLTAVSCYGASTGTVAVEARGGVPGYTFSLNGRTSTTGIFSKLPAGIYQVNVTDRIGCSVQVTVEITQPAEALATADLKITPVSCSGEASGSIRITASGGTAPYVYSVNGRNSATGEFTGLAAGNYEVLVTDAAGCTLVVPAGIAQVPPLDLSSVSSPVSCSGGNDGTITATATGGSPAYTYTLNQESNSTGIFRNLPAGAYVVRVRDSLGCTAITQVTVGQPRPLAGAVSTGHVTGPGLADGTATVTVTGGTPGYTFTLNGRTNTTGRFTGLSAGSYTVTITDAAGCTLPLPVQIATLNRVDLTPVMTIIPEGKTASVTARLAQPFSDDVVVTLRYSGNASPKSDYLLTGQVQSIRIPKGSVSTTGQVTVHALSDAVAEPEEDVRIDIIATSDPLVLIGSPATVVIQDIVPDDPLTSDPVPENKDLFPEPTVSPNDDGQGNDYFNIGNILSFPENEVVIFNRWGNVVFRVKGYNTTDKVFRGFANTGIGIHAPKPLVDGVYYYVIYTYKTIGAVKEQRLNKGYLILKR